MKRIMKQYIMIVVVICLLLGDVSQINVVAKTNNRVSFTLKKGVLTIKGKGDMPKTMTFTNNKKIKKVIIKKGITSISRKAFLGCKNLKKVFIANTVKEIGVKSFEKTGLSHINIPNSVKIIGIDAFDGTKLESVSMPGDFEVKEEKKSYSDGIFDTETKKCKYIALTSPLKLENVGHFLTKNIYVWEKDPLYKSINGVIYSKDGKELVRVPFYKEKFIIEEGCKTFCLSSISYEFDSYANYHYLFSKKIKFPSSVTKIDDKKYTEGTWSNQFWEIEPESIEGDVSNLDTESIIKFTNYLKMASEPSMTCNEICESFPNRIIKKDGFYICDDTILIAYTSSKKTINIPEGITRLTYNFLYDSFNYCDTYIRRKNVILNLPDTLKIIDKETFEFSGIEKITLPEGLEKIGSRAFADAYINSISIPNSVKKFGKEIFLRSSLKKVSLPSNMKIIPEAMFSECKYLKDVKINSNINTIGKYAFDETSVNIQKILSIKSLKTLKAGCLSNISSDKKLIIPKHIKIIESRALATDKKRTVIVEGSTKRYAYDSFVHPYKANKVTIKFKKGINIKEQFTTSDWVWENKKTIEVYWCKLENIDGYEIIIYSDKKRSNKLGKYKTDNKQNKLKILIPAQYKNKIKPYYYRKVYGKIRPYKIIKGKIKYGRWTDL